MKTNQIFFPQAGRSDDAGFQLKIIITVELLYLIIIMETLRMMIRYLTKNNQVFLVLIFLASCQNNKNQSIENSDLSNKVQIESKQLIKDYIKYELKKDSIILAETPITYRTKYDLEDADKYIGTINIDSLLDRSKKDTLLWSNKTVPNSKIITQKDIRKLIYPVMLSDYSKVLGNGFFNFTHPVFFKNFTYGIMLSMYNCGSRCGSKELLIFKKNHNSWVLTKKFTLAVF